MFSQLDLTVGLNLLAGLQNVFHDGSGIGAIGKLNDHLLRHEIHGSGGNALGLAGCLLHQVRAVGTGNFDLICLFHFQTLLFNF